MKLYTIGIYENEEKIKLTCDEEECEKYEDKIFVKVPLFLSDIYSTQYLESQHMNRWVYVNKNFKAFYTLDLELRDKEYKKLINDRIKSLNIEKDIIDKKLGYLRKEKDNDKR